MHAHGESNSRQEQYNRASCGVADPRPRASAASQTKHRVTPCHPPPLPEKAGAVLPPAKMQEEEADDAALV